MVRANPFPYVLYYSMYFLLFLFSVLGLGYLLWIASPQVVTTIAEGPLPIAIGVLIVAFAAILTGQRWARREERAMTFGEGWFLTLMLTLLTVVICGGIFALLLRIDGYTTAEQQQVAAIFANRSGLSRFFLVVVAVLLSIHRFALWTGARGLLKHFDADKG